MRDILSRLALGLALTLIVLLLSSVAVGFLCAAIYLGLTEVTTPPLAALGTGLAVLLAALVIALTARVVSRGPARARHTARLSASQTRDARFDARVSKAVGEEIGRLTKTHAAGATIAALAAGFAVGLSPRLRRTLWQLLE